MIVVGLGCVLEGESDGDDEVIELLLASGVGECVLGRGVEEFCELDCESIVAGVGVLDDVGFCCVVAGFQMRVYVCDVLNGLNEAA